MHPNTQTLDLRSLIRELAADAHAVVYVTDTKTLWQIVGVDAGCFVLTDCAYPMGKSERQRTVTAVELALAYRRVEARLSASTVAAVGEPSNCD